MSFPHHGVANNASVDPYHRNAALVTAPGFAPSHSAGDNSASWGYTSQPPQQPGTGGDAFHLSSQQLPPPAGVYPSAYPPTMGLFGSATNIPLPQHQYYGYPPPPTAPGFAQPGASYPIPTPSSFSPPQATPPVGWFAPHAPDASYSAYYAAAAAVASATNGNTGSAPLSRLAAGQTMAHSEGSSSNDDSVTGSGNTHRQSARDGSGSGSSGQARTSPRDAASAPPHAVFAPRHPPQQHHRAQHPPAISQYPPQAVPPPLSSHSMPPMMHLPHGPMPHAVPPPPPSSSDDSRIAVQHPVLPPPPPSHQYPQWTNPEAQEVPARGAANQQGAMLRESPSSVTAGDRPTCDEATSAATGPPKRGMRQLIVNYLDNQTTGAELLRIFNEVGEVDSVRVMYDTNSNLPLGYGFVYFQDPDAARDAVACMNGYPLRKKRLKVSFANPVKQTVRRRQRLVARRQGDADGDTDAEATPQGGNPAVDSDGQAALDPMDDAPASRGTLLPQDQHQDPSRPESAISGRSETSSEAAQRVSGQQTAGAVRAWTDSVSEDARTATTLAEHLYFGAPPADEVRSIVAAATEE